MSRDEWLLVVIMAGVIVIAAALLWCWRHLKRRGAEILKALERMRTVGVGASDGTLPDIVASALDRERSERLARDRQIVEEQRGIRQQMDILTQSVQADLRAIREKLRTLMIRFGFLDKRGE